ncbi:recombination regulator RecX [uncultured Methylophaga sp.]|uniref:recombination regulator RecX n=1 Tax=uncultured Methylophaga sp. TaxID=285271 RepID=UPI00261C2B4D|nr:recombination regulator RecX [uncultured Methylophaga sp.]
MKKTASEQAVSYLARREHSALELRRKLDKSGFDTADIELVLSQLQQADLQSDERFAESYVRSRTGRGYGKTRIRMELQERGVADELIRDSLQQAEIDWFALAAEVRRKRFGEQNPEDFKSRAKQQRFLQYRGFSHDEITESFNLTDNEK